MLRGGDVAKLDAEQVNVKRALGGMDGLERILTINLQQDFFAGR
jgi:hypothetical protein